MIAVATARRAAWRRFADNGLRLIAAAPLGYAVASLWGMVLARILPGDRAEAAVTGSLAALALCACAAMYAYAARSGWRAFWVLVVLGVMAGGITWFSIESTGRL